MRLNTFEILILIVILVVGCLVSGAGVEVRVKESYADY